MVVFGTMRAVLLKVSLFFIGFFSRNVAKIWNDIHTDFKDKTDFCQHFKKFYQSLDAAYIRWSQREIAWEMVLYIVNLVYVWLIFKIFINF